jgi:hypothetical protein
VRSRKRSATQSGKERGKSGGRQFTLPVYLELGAVKTRQWPIDQNSCNRDHCLHQLQRRSVRTKCRFRTVHNGERSVSNWHGTHGDNGNENKNQEAKQPAADHLCGIEFDQLGVNRLHGFCFLDRILPRRRAA